jgi:hypothetical protein
MGLMGLVRVILALHPNNLANLFILTAIITEGRKKFCFPETKKCDFWIFSERCSTTDGHGWTGMCFVNGRLSKISFLGVE